MVGKNVQYNHNVVVAFSATGQATLTQAFQQSNTALLGYQRNLQTVNTQLANSGRAQSTYQQAVNQSTGVTKTFSAGLAQTTPFVAGLNTNIASTGAPFKNMNQNIVTAGQRFKNLAGAMKENIMGFGLAAAGIISVAQEFTRLHRAQVMAERANVAYERSQNKVNDLHIKLTAAIQKYGEGSQKVIEIQKDLKIAEDANSVTKERAEVMQERLNDITAEFYSQIVPQLILAGTGVISMLTNMGVEFSAVSGLLPALQAGFLELAGAEDVAALSARGLATALATIAIPLAAVFLGITIGNAVLTKSKQELDSYVQHFGDSVLKITGFEEALLNIKALFGDAEAKKTLDLLNKQKLAIQALHDEMVKGNIAAGKGGSLLDFFNMSKQEFDKLIDDVSKKSPDLAKKIKDAFGGSIPAINQNTASLQENTFAAGDAVVAATNQRNIHRADVQLYDELTNAGNKHATTLNNLTGVTTRYSETTKGQVVVGSENADVLARLTKEISTLTPEEKAAELEAKMLNITVKEQNSALAEGTKQFTNFTDSVTNGTDAANVFRDKLVAWAIGEFNIKDAMLLTNDQIIHRISLLTDNNAKVEEAQRVTEELKQTMSEFSKIDENVAKSFNVKLPKDNKFTKMLTNLLPDKLKKKIDLQLEFSGKSQAFKEQLTTWLGDVLQGVTLPDKDADKLGNAILKAMDKTFGKGKDPKGLEGLHTAIQNAVAAPDTGDKLKQIINEIKLDKPIQVPVVFNTDKAFGKGAHSGFFNGGLFLGNASDKDIQGPTMTIQTELDNTTANTELDTLKTDISNLSNTQASISLDNAKAVQKVADTAGRIKQLSTFKPFINLDNSKAVQKVADVKGRINALSSLTPTITVKVKYDTSGKPTQHGGSWIRNAQHGAVITRPQIIDGVRTGEHSKPELITVTPLTNSANVADTTLKLKSTSDDSMSGLKEFMGNILDAIQSIRMNAVFQVDGNDIVQTKDVFASVSPLMGKNMTKYGSN